VWFKIENWEIATHIQRNSQITILINIFYQNAGMSRYQNPRKKQDFYKTIPASNQVDFQNHTSFKF
jgi:hypothetical protein